MSGTKTMCTLCNLMLNSYDQFVAHKAGRAHKRKESSAGSASEQQLSASVTKIVRPNSFIKFVSGQNNNNPVVSSQNLQNQSGTSGENHTDEALVTDVSLSQQNEVFCNTCMVRLTSQAQADMHFSGFKHKRAVALTASGASGENRGEGIKRKIEEICEVCKVPLITKVVADAHYAGAKHEKKLKLSQNVNTASSSLPYSSLPGISSGASYPSKAPAGNLFFCNYCKVSVNSQMQMDAHQQGTKHKNAVNGVVPQRKKPFKPRQPQEQNRFINPQETVPYVKPPELNRFQEHNRFQEQGRYISPNHFQTGNYGSPNGSMQFRPVAYPTPYY